MIAVRITLMSFNVIYIADGRIHKRIQGNNFRRPAEEIDVFEDKILGILGQIDPCRGCRMLRCIDIVSVEKYVGIYERHLWSTPSPYSSNASVLS